MIHENRKTRGELMWRYLVSQILTKALAGFTLNNQPSCNNSVNMFDENMHTEYRNEVKSKPLEIEDSIVHSGNAPRQWTTE